MRRRSLPRRALVPGTALSSSGSRPAGRSATGSGAGSAGAAAARSGDVRRCGRGRLERRGGRVRYERRGGAASRPPLPARLLTASRSGHRRRAASTVGCSSGARSAPRLGRRVCEQGLMAARRRRGSWRARPRLRAAPPSAARCLRDLRSAGWTSVGTGRSWSVRDSTWARCPERSSIGSRFRSHDPFNGSSALKRCGRRADRATPRRRARPSRRPRTAPRGRARRRADRRPRDAAGAPPARRRGPTARSTRPRSRAARRGWIPTGVPNAGTPHASASITDSPKPSSADGTSTALAALIQYGTSSGGTSPSVSNGTSPAASTARS